MREVISGRNGPYSRFITWLFLKELTQEARTATQKDTTSLVSIKLHFQVQIYYSLFLHLKKFWDKDGRDRRNKIDEKTAL